MSHTVSVIILVAIMAVAAVIAVIVYIKVQRGEWLNSFRLDKSQDLTQSHEDRPVPRRFRWPF